MNTPAIQPSQRGTIRIRGARVHNLQSISVDLPHSALIVCTGVSGSGKSSLAFDTLFAEGQRRGLATLGSAVRQRVALLSRPDCDSVTGLPPVIAVSQRNAGGSPRGTLATLAEIAPFLRLLFARAGVAHCPRCNRPVVSQTLEEIVAAVSAGEPGRKALLLANVARDRRGAHRDTLAQLVRQGLVRARIDGEVVDLSVVTELSKGFPHTIDAVVDRVVLREGLQQRLRDSLGLALKLGDGACTVSIETVQGWTDRVFSARHTCVPCGLALPGLSPQSLNSNTPQGACQSCAGLGSVSPPSAGANGALTGRLPCQDCGGTRLGPVGRAVQYRELTLPRLLSLTVDAAAELWQAWCRDPDPLLERMGSQVGKRLQFLQHAGLGYLALDRPTETLSGGELQRARLAGALGSGLVGVCFVLDEPTTGLHARDTAQLLAALRALRDQGNTVVVVEHDVEVMRAADWLVDLGPGAGTEGGRIVVAGPLCEVVNHPDSPTAKFLQPGSQRRKGLGDAPLTLPLTPAAVSRGVLVSPDAPQGSLELSGVRLRNLRGDHVVIPLQRLVCVTGVSGSGKSSLVMEGLVPLLRDSLRQRIPVMREGETPDRARLPVATLPADVGFLQGADLVTRLCVVDQSPSPRAARANPATLSGVWTEIRRLLARSRDARRLGFGAARFSRQSLQGRCPTCRGLGTRPLPLDWLPGTELDCPVCRGTGFNPQTLEVRLFDRHVAELLALSLSDAVAVFRSFARIAPILQTFVDLGLGYLTLGQSATSLSGGEAQRVKLACELARSRADPGAGATLYILDEPTTGLHPADIERLQTVLRDLVTQGHSVLAIEHQLDLVASADWLIDLGPEGGLGGGCVIATGSPRQVAAGSDGHTARALREFLA